MGGFSGNLSMRIKNVYTCKKPSNMHGMGYCENVSPSVNMSDMVFCMRIFVSCGIIFIGFCCYE